MEAFDPIAHYYDLDCGRYEQDLTLYLNLASRTGPPILEVGCGTGRVLEALATAGHQVTGIDPSGAMLAVARERLSGLVDGASLIQARAESFHLPRRFPLAIFALGGFNLLVEPAQQRRALVTVRDHLLPGGLLVLDLAALDPIELAEVDRALLLEWVRQDPETGETVTKTVCRIASGDPGIEHATIFYDRVAADGTVRRVVGQFDQRRVTPGEITLLLEQAGFWLEHIYGSYDLDEYASTSDRMIVVARR